MTPTMDCTDMTNTATGHSSVVTRTPYLSNIKRSQLFCLASGKKRKGWIQFYFYIYFYFYINSGRFFGDHSPDTCLFNVFLVCKQTADLLGNLN